MKNILFASALLMFLFSSCAKTDPKGGGKGHNPTQDTIYLPKTSTTYYVGANGAVNDTAAQRWVYDDLRRITKSVTHFYSINQTDTMSFTYSSTQAVEQDVIYTSGVLQYYFTATSYLNAKGTTDSAITIDSYNNTQETIYTYNQAGLDSFHLNYNVVNGQKQLAQITRNYYSNGSLVLILDSTPDNSFSAKTIWSNGNLISDTAYYGGSIGSTNEYTYTNLLSGEMSFFVGGTNLAHSLATTIFQPMVPTSVETYAYTFDAANRISTIVVSKGNAVEHTTVYSYY